MSSAINQSGKYLQVYHEVFMLKVRVMSGNVFEIVRAAYSLKLFTIGHMKKLDMPSSPICQPFEQLYSLLLVI